MPPSAGPAITPIWPATPRSASAPGTSSVGTISGVIARAAGLPTTFATPATRREPRNGQSSRCARQRHEDERDGDRDREHERAGRDRAPRQPVGDLPGREREERQRQELHQPDEAEVERVAVDRVDLPADRDREHLRREPVREERRPEKPEVADLQRGRRRCLTPRRLGSGAWPSARDDAGEARVAARAARQGAARRQRARGRSAAARRAGCSRASAPRSCATQARSSSSTATCATASRTSG